MDGWEDLQLAAIGDSEDLLKQIDHALAEVAKNIVDPNTDITVVREVTAKIKFRPSADRKAADIKYKVNTKLAGDAPGTDRVELAKDGRGYVSMRDQLPLAGIGVVDEGGERKVVETGGENAT